MDRRSLTRLQRPARLASSWSSRLTDYTVAVEAGCSGTVDPVLGRVTMTIPTGTQRITPSTAGVRVIWPLVDTAGAPVLAENVPSGAIRAAFVAGMVSGAATGVRVWLGFLDSTAAAAIATALGSGLVARDAGATLEHNAWRKMAAGVYQENAAWTANDLDELHSQWAWNASRIVNQGGGFALAGGAVVDAEYRSGSGSFAAGQLYAFVGLGLGQVADPGGTVVVDVSHALVQRP